MSYTVFSCGSNPQVETVGGREFATCESGQGAWVEIDATPPFDESLLRAEDLGQALGAGFVVMATGLVIVQAARALLRAF